MENIKTYGNLVRLLDLDKDFIIDLKYATENNFTGSKVYESGQCYIDINTAKMLIKAKELAKQHGYKIKVWDAYRPTSAQQRFWDILPDNDFVAYPPDMATLKEFKNSHMNGQCVDVSLTDSNDCDIPMPSDFDDFSDKAKLSFAEENSQAKKNAEFLRDIMVKCGFTPYSGEWWHFYDHQTIPVPYSDFKL